MGSSGPVSYTHLDVYKRQAIPFNNLPAAQSQPIIMGWVSNWMYADKIPTEGFRGMFSLPRALSLYQQDGVYRLRQNPIFQDKLPVRTLTMKASDLAAGVEMKLDGNSYRLDLTIEPVSYTHLDVYKRQLVQFELELVARHFVKARVGLVAQILQVHGRHVAHKPTGFEQLT